MNNLYVNTIKKYLYIYIVLIIEPYSCVTDDILCVWTFGLPGLYNVIKIIIIIIIINIRISVPFMRDTTRARARKYGKDADFHLSSTHVRQ